MGDEYDPAYPTNEIESENYKERSLEKVMKPEKVKSRWRRSSELECGDFSNRSPELPRSFHRKMSLFNGKESPVKITESEIKENFDSSPEEHKSRTHKNNSIPNQEIKHKIPGYDPLEENQYLFERKRTKKKKEVRRLLCECSLSKEEQESGTKGCEDECLNRLLMIECGSRCATGEACTNKRFQKRLYAKAEPFKTEKKGWGLNLLEDMSVGSFIIEYCGEVLSRQEFKHRVKKYAREKSDHYYFMALNSDEIIDATIKGNLSRFINHSCDPNCETQKWTVNGELRIGFFAKRDLKTGEELTFDYQFQRYGREAQKCYCESELCSGYIGVSKQITIEVSTSKSNLKRKKAIDENKREVFEDLIDAFRIPRLEQQKRRDAEREAARYDQKNGMNKQYSQSISKHGESRNSHWENNHYSREKSRKKARKKSRSVSKEPHSSTQEKTGDRKSFSNYYDDTSEPPRKVLLPTPKVLSKAERRQLFALEVQQRDQKEALRKQSEISVIENFSGDPSNSFDQHYYDSASYGNSYNSGQTYSPQNPENELFAGGNSLVSVISSEHVTTPNNGYDVGLRQCLRPVLLPTPESLNNIMPAGTATYPSNVLYNSVSSDTSYAETSPFASQGTALSLACQSAQPEINHAPVSSAFMRTSGVNSSHTVPPVVVAESEDILSPMNSLMSSAPVSSAQSNCQNSVSPVVPGYFSNQSSTASSQTQQVYYVQQHYSTSHLSDQVCVMQSVPHASVNGEGSLSPAQSFIRLPPNWKTATDAEGNIYYYHVITRQAQWDPPEMEEIGEDGDSGTPTFDEPKEHKSEMRLVRSCKKISKRKSTTTAPADTSCNTVTTDIAKKIKELFRTKMSSFVVQCLNPYRKPDCTLGRIASTDDFKHLARKLTHFVMAKELKHCKNVEELECNENVKHKAKDFIQKYMIKYGPLYRKNKGSPFGD